MNIIGLKLQGYVNINGNIHSLTSLEVCDSLWISIIESYEGHILSNKVFRNVFWQQVA